MSFNKRSNAAPVCHSKPLDSVKNWNDHFSESTPRPSLFLCQMDLFSFIRHSDPTKVRVGEREAVAGDVKLLTSTEGRVVLLVPPASTALGGNNDSIDKLFHEGIDARQEHSIGRDDDVLVEAVTKDVLREDYCAATSSISGNSLATISGLILEGSSVSSEGLEVGLIRRIQGIGYGVLEFLGVGTTFDIFQNIHILYLQYGVSTSSGYGVLIFFPLWSLVSCGNDGLIDSVSGLNLRTRPPTMRYVVSSDDSYHSDSHFEVNSFARSPVADAYVMTVSVTTTIVADVFVVSKVRVESKNLEVLRDSTSAGGANVNVASTSKLNEPANSSDSFYASQNLDSETLHRIYLYSEFNVGAARKMCLGAEVRMRDEYTLEQKDKLEDKCAKQPALLSEKDTEIADLKSLLSLKEAESAEIIQKNLAFEEEKSVLSEKVTTPESVAAVKETELVSLTAQIAKLTSDLSGFQLSCDELSSKAASIESERDRLADQRSSLESAFELFKGRMEAMQDEQVTAQGNRVAELDAQLLEMDAHLEEEFYTRFLTTVSGLRWILTRGLKLVLLKCLQPFEYLCTLGETINCEINKGIQDGLKVGINHGKAGRDLSVIEAYDPSAKAKYVDAVNALRTLNFSLLFVLRSKKDACMANLMDSLRLEGPLAEIHRAKELQPSLEQLTFPVYRAEDIVVLGETSLSFSLQVVHSRVQRVRRDYRETFVAYRLSDYQGLDAEPHDEDPPAITFKEEELDTTPE
ncbi:hypothetical protein Tco_0199487 [Tanacetum coccineum]